MKTNDPGREPEPTDAVNELAKMNNVNAWAKGQLRILAEMAEDRGLDFFCRDAKRIADGITVLDRIPGARPMPEKPNCPETPDSSARCDNYRTILGVVVRCEMPAGHEGRHCTSSGGIGWSWTHGSTSLTMPDTPAPDEDEFKTALVNELTEAYAQLLLEHGGLKNANTALTARVAELERENAALEAVVKAAVVWHCAGVRLKPVAEDDLCDAIGDYLNKSAPGKEPPDA